MCHLHDLIIQSQLLQHHQTNPMSFAETGDGYDLLKNWSQSTHKKWLCLDTNKLDMLLFSLSPNSMIMCANISFAKHNCIYIIRNWCSFFGLFAPASHYFCWAIIYPSAAKKKRIGKLTGRIWFKQKSTDCAARLFSQATNKHTDESFVWSSIDVDELFAEESVLSSLFFLSPLSNWLHLCSCSRV